MRFEQELQGILKKLRDTDSARSKYLRDAFEIAEDAIQMPSSDGALVGFIQSGSLDRTKLKTPDEFDFHMKVKLPFPLIPKKDEKGFVFLYAEDIYKHPMVVNNYVNRKKLDDWFGSKVKSVGQCQFKCISGECYDLKAKDNGCAQTIEAEGKHIAFSVDLVPAFEFTFDKWPLDMPPISAEVDSKWYAVPHSKRGSSGDERTFMVCSPHWEREATKDLKNFDNVLRLMKGVRDANVHDLPHLSSYMLKTVLLHQLGRVDWKKDLGTLFLEMWSCLVDHLNSGNLDFFLCKGNNMFDPMPYVALLDCRISAERLLADFKKAENNSLESLCLDPMFNV